jgi:cyanate lyase
MTISTETTTSLVDRINSRKAELGISDDQLSQELGFDKLITVTLLKTGAIRPPINKIPALAIALDLDTAELMKVALSEADPALWETISEVFNPMRLSATELNLVKHVREVCGDRKVAPIVFSNPGVVALVSV